MTKCYESLSGIHSRDLASRDDGERRNATRVERRLVIYERSRHAALTSTATTRYPSTHDLRYPNATEIVL